MDPQALLQAWIDSGSATERSKLASDYDAWLARGGFMATFETETKTWTVTGLTRYSLFVGENTYGYRWSSMTTYADIVVPA